MRRCFLSRVPLSSKKLFGLSQLPEVKVQRKIKIKIFSGKKFKRWLPLGALMASLLALVVLVIVVQSPPDLLLRLFRKGEWEEGKAAVVINESIFTKYSFAEDGSLLVLDEKRVTFSDEPEVIINGKKTSEIPKEQPNIILVEEGEEEPTNPYIITFKQASLAEKKLELENQGLLKARVKEEVKAYKKTLASESERNKVKIESKIKKQLVKGAPQKEQRRILEEFDTLLNGLALKLSSQEAELIKELPEVEKISPSKELELFLDVSVPMIRANEAWSLIGPLGAPLTGYGVTIGVIDTGIDYTHPDLGGCTNMGPGCKVVDGYDFYNKDTNPMDEHGHGTHVAATAAGDGFLKGVAPGATLYAYKVFGTSGNTYDTVVLPAMERCLDPNLDGDLSDHLDVCTMSLGGIGNPDDELSLAADNGMKNGVVFTIAAGNSGPSSNTIQSPGTSREAITVGAACKDQDVGVNSRCNAQIASFSSRGPVEWSDLEGGFQRMVKPDLVAPGVNICAAQWDDWYSSNRCKDDKHIAISGTSMATPHVAGVAALLRQAMPLVTPADIKLAMKQTAVPYEGFDENTQGKGLVNTYEALKFLSPNLDFSPKVFSTPFSWMLTGDITSTGYTSSQDFVITNNTDQATTAVISTRDIPEGISLLPSVSSLTIPANGIANLTVELQADFSVLVSGQKYLLKIVLDSPAKVLYIPVYFSVPNRVRVTPGVDFGVDVPSDQGIWTATKTLTLTNLQDVPGAYSLTHDCCSQPGVSLSLSQETVSLEAAQTREVQATISIDNSLVPNGIWAGRIVVSSSLQSSIYIPFEASKYCRLKVTYPANEAPSSVAIYDDSGFEKNANVGTNNSLTFFLDQIYPALDIMGRFEYYPPGTGEAELKYIVLEEQPLTGDDTVFLDPATGTIEYRFAPTGVYGEDLSQVSLKHQSPILALKSGSPGSYHKHFHSFRPLVVKFNPLSDRYGFTHVIFEPPASERGEEYFYQYTQADGITQSLTFSNTPQEINSLPIDAFPNVAEISSIQYRPSLCSSMKSHIFCSSFDGPSFRRNFNQEDNRYRYYLYGLKNSSETAFALNRAKYYLSSKVISSGSEEVVFNLLPMMFTDQGVLRWGKSTNEGVNYVSPILIEETVKPLRNGQMAVGALPYHFDLQWLISPDYKYTHEIGHGFMSQEWDQLSKGKTFLYKLSQNGSVIKQGETYSVYLRLDDLIDNSPATYELEYYGTEQINGQTVSYSHKGQFIIPENFDSKDDAQPPNITYLDFLSDGFTSQFVNSGLSQTLAFGLIPSRKGSSDVITQARVRMKTDISDWQVLNLQSSDIHYSAIIPLVSNANLYTFEIYAEDSHGNNLTYTFQLPRTSTTIPYSFSLSPGWNEILWPTFPGISSSDVPDECPLAVSQENFWFKPYVINYGGGDFGFESGRNYWLRCNQETVWNL